MVVEHRVVGFSVYPHSIDDFEPTLSQAAQGIGVTRTFLAMMLIVDLSPDALVQSMFGKKVHRVAQVPVTSPTLVARPAVRMGSDFAFAGPAGDRRAAGQTLQGLGSILEAPAVITDFG